MLKSRIGSIVRGIIAIVAGIFFVCSPTLALDVVVKVLAGFFVLVGLIIFIRLIRTNGKNYLKSFDFITFVANIVLGLLIFIYPHFFINLIPLLFGFLLLIIGIYKIMKQSALKINKWKYYVLPIIVVLCGLIMFFMPGTVTKTVTICFGILVILYGVSELLFAPSEKDAEVKINK